jgi:hypothetical protein
MGCASGSSCGGSPVITVVCESGLLCSAAASAPAVGVASASSVNRSTGYYVDRDVSFAMSYGANAYYMESAAKESMSSYEHLHVMATGGYGGDVYNWCVLMMLMLMLMLLWPEYNLISGFGSFCVEKMVFYFLQLL